jgi:hypothetical protein
VSLKPLIDTTHGGTIALQVEELEERVMKRSSFTLMVAVQSHEEMIDQI